MEKLLARVILSSILNIRKFEIIVYLIRMIPFRTIFSSESLHTLLSSEDFQAYIFGTCILLSSIVAIWAKFDTTISILLPKLIQRTLEFGSNTILSSKFLQ